MAFRTAPALALCATLLTLGAPPAAGGEIRLAFSISDDIFLAPVFAAEKLGYFKSANVTIKRLNLRGADVIAQAIKAGQVDITDMSGPAAVQAIAGGLPARIVATAGRGFYGWTVIVRSESSARSFSHLAGKTIAVSTTHSLSDLASTLAAERTKVRFEISTVGAGSLVPELRSGKVDAILSSALVGLREVSAGRARVVLELGNDRTPRVVSAYVASNAAIAKSPADIRGFLAATYQALAHMKSDRKWALELLREYGKLSDNAYAERIYDNVIRAMSGDAANDSESLRNILDLAARGWKEPELTKLDPARFFTNDFVTTAP